MVEPGVATAPEDVNVILAVVCPTDEVTLSCMSSLLRLHLAVAERRNVSLNIHLLTNLNDALNIGAKESTSDAWIVVVDGAVGFPAEFVIDLLNGKAPDDTIVAGVYPTAVVKWDRVERLLKAGTTTERREHMGNVYNVSLSSGTQRYVPVSAVKELKVMAMRRAVLDAFPNAGAAYDDGILFATEGVHDGKLENAWQRFVRMAGRTVVADVEAGCTLSAPAAFTGCVGQRRVLR